MKRKSLVDTLLPCWLALTLSAFAGGANDVLTPAAPGAVRLEGWLGQRMASNLAHHVMAQNVDRIIQPFRDRQEENSGHWRCEYWGKWFTSAALGYAYQPTPAHRAVLERGLRDLLATQTPDGYIGTYKPNHHLGIWDVWGRKYTLLGLLAEYDLTGNPKALVAARRVGDHLLMEAPSGTFDLTENGIDVLKGLPSSSILEPLALLYQRTGEKRYLDLAEDIIARWNQPNRFFAEGARLIELGLAGVPPRQIGARKAYEMMSCFEGVCEMYRITGRSEYLESAIGFAQSIRRTELMVHGSGSNQELWCDGTRVQTELLEQPVETCVTVTWMKLCDQLLRLTGDPLWADELEVSLYNALLGAMTPDGAWWAYFSPLAGQRVPSHYQTHLVLCDCASAGNGWNSDNRLRVWLPQPLFLRQAFPADTWRLMCPELKECPTIPKSAAVENGSEPPVTRMPQATLTVAGDWSLEVKVTARDGVQTLTRTLAVAKPTAVSVANERYASLDAWNVATPGWARSKLLSLEDGICSSRFALVPGTVNVASASEPAVQFRLDEDFKVDLEWGAIGRIPEGAIASTQAVLVSYQFTQRRLDSVVLNRAGQLELRQGAPHLSMPVPPSLAAGEVRLANVFVPEKLKQLGPTSLFPILETRFPEPPKASPSEAEQRLPRTIEKLRNGEPLKILAWGDSVTQGYLGEDQWQNQFVYRLQQRFPSARIELVTVGWGGHNSQDFLDAPPGHVRNFAESVLAAKPDLVISEFVNDVPLDTGTVEGNYRRFLADFRAIGAEWVILTPHFSTFMNWPSERDLDDDPRPYVQILRRFAREQDVALADAAARYGRLWRQGIPYSTLMVNACNHPDARGMAVFADSLMALFP